MTASAMPAEITLRQFLRGLEVSIVPEDDALTADTLRLMIRDYRDHARRLLAEMQTDA